MVASLSEKVRLEKPPAEEPPLQDEPERRACPPIKRAGLRAVVEENGPRINAVKDEDDEVDDGEQGRGELRAGFEMG